MRYSAAPLPLQRHAAEGQEEGGPRGRGGARATPRADAGAAGAARPLVTVDAIERAKTLLEKSPGGTGADSEAQGSSYGREQICKFIAQRDGGKFKLVYAAAHCHAPACINETLYDVATGDIICFNRPLFGKGIEPRLG